MIKSKIEIREEEREIILDVWLMNRNNAKRIKIFKTVYISVGIILLLFSVYNFLKNSIGIGIVALVYSILFTFMGLNIKREYKKIQRKKQYKQYKEIKSGEIEYEFSNEGIHITSILGVGMNYWNAFYSYGQIEHYIYVIRKDEQIIIVDKRTLTNDEIDELLALLDNIK